MTTPRMMPASWTVEVTPSGYRVVDAKGKALAHVDGLEPRELSAAGHERLSKDEAGGLQRGRYARDLGGCLVAGLSRNRCPRGSSPCIKRMLRDNLRASPR